MIHLLGRGTWRVSIKARGNSSKSAWTASTDLIWKSILKCETLGKKKNNTETIKVNTKLVERRDQKVPQKETYEHWKEIQTNE